MTTKWHTDYLAQELEDGIMKMGPLAAHLLDARVAELQEKAYLKGLAIQTKVMREWIKHRKGELAKSKYAGSEFAIGAKNTLVDMEGFLKEIDDMKKN
jgi:hypothetical protein